MSRRATTAICLVALALALAAASPARAVFGHSYSSRVDGAATLLADGNTAYAFSVVNTSEPIDLYRIVDWELPIFSLGDVLPGSVICPDGWTYEIISPDATTAYYNNPNSPYGEYRWSYDPSGDPLLGTDPDAYGVDASIFVDPPYIIHWYTEANSDFQPIAAIHAFGPDDPLSSLAGFGFVSQYSATGAPNQTSWYMNPARTNDPPIPGHSGGLLPDSPSFRGQDVPEPSALMVLIGGLASAAGWSALLRRRALR